MLKSIYKAQLSLHVGKYEVLSLFVDGRSLRPYDCMSISYFMSVVPITHLLLCDCGIGDREAEILARCKDLVVLLKVLDLSYNNVTHKGMESVVTTIKCCINLTHFSIAHNPVGDDGIQLFSLLKLEQLIQLDIRDIKMTEVGTRTFGECFKFNRSLQ